MTAAAVISPFGRMSGKRLASARDRVLITRACSDGLIGVYCDVGSGASAGAAAWSLTALSMLHYAGFSLLATPLASSFYDLLLPYRY